MIRILNGAALAALCLFSAPSTVRAEQPAQAGTRTEPTADLAAILDYVDDLYSSKSSHTSVAMHVVTEHATRDMKMETWSKGEERFLVRILAPEKEAGTSTLKNGTNVWNYFPKINQVTKVSASLMNAGWMGSHVTNGDIVKRNRMSQSYTYAKSFEGDREGQNVIELTLDPKPNAPVVWGKVVVIVRRSDRNPLQIRYYDEGKALAQTWSFSDIRKLGGRDVPTTIKVVPASKPREYTELHYTSMELNIALDDTLFSQRSLQK
ncbi:outer membrane lipoprotein-sorting protein [Pendulispora rubella]|uniref:Outer membrane lipoprotein-sorting protein n=1 Tax=Pendulispora rubella TaxID=2741070 RepID=A0ABZ2L1E9_9BACT